MTVIELREHSTAEVELTQDQLRVLLALDDKILRVRGSLRGPGWYVLEARQFCGSVHWPQLDTTLVIRPKLPIERLLFLMGYADRASALREEIGVVHPSAGLIEAMAIAFVRQVEQATRRGVIHGYRETQESLNVLRGRVDFAAQLRKRPGQWSPLEVRHDRFTSNIVENRALVAALDRLTYAPSLSQRARSIVKALLSRFEGVELIRLSGADVRAIPIHRLNRHYALALSLAAWVLDDQSVESFDSPFAMRCWLVNLASVFEDFVLRALRESLGVGAERLPPGRAVGKRRRFPLDEERSSHLEPDLSWWEAERCRLVGDVKYRSSDRTSPFDNDLKQVLAYTVAADLHTGWLIYATEPNGPRCQTIRGRTIRRTGLDLDLPPAGVLQQIDALAKHLRASIGIQAAS